MKAVDLIVIGVILISAGLTASFSFLFLTKQASFKPDLTKVREYKSQLPKFYIVLSGSMEPTLKVGSVAMVLPQKDYFPGEVVSFLTGTGKNSTVTHRILAKNYPNGIDSAPVFLTAGDANKNFDSQNLKEEQIVGKYAVSVPYLGYLIDYVKKPYGFILFVIVPATILIYEETLKIKRELASILSKKKQAFNENAFS